MRIYTRIGDKEWNDLSIYLLQPRNNNGVQAFPVAPIPPTPRTLLGPRAIVSCCIHFFFPSIDQHIPFVGSTFFLLCCLFLKLQEKAFEFVKVVRAAYEICCMVQYIIFQAKQGDEPPETFKLSCLVYTIPRHCSGHFGSNPIISVLGKKKICILRISLLASAKTDREFSDSGVHKPHSF